MAFALQGKWEEALPPAAMAAELAPTVQDYWQFLGKVQITTGRVDDARRVPPSMPERVAQGKVIAIGRQRKSRW